MTKRKRRAFTEQFKADAVRLVKASDRGVGQVAKELDLTETALREWVKRDEINAGKGPPDALTTVGQEALLFLNHVESHMAGHVLARRCRVGHLDGAQPGWHRLGCTAPSRPHAKPAVPGLASPVPRLVSP